MAHLARVVAALASLLFAAGSGGGTTSQSRAQPPARLIAVDLVSEAAWPAPPEGARACETLPLRADVYPGEWPPYSAEGRYAEEVAAARRRYASIPLDYRDQLGPYSPQGDYMNYGATLDYEGDPTLQFDELGIPLVPYDGVFYYNPITVAEFALTLHGRYLLGTAPLDRFLGAADFLLSLQDGRGAFPFPFAYTYYLTGERLQAGWVSGMAQGQALSVFARAYELSGEARYLEGGRLTLSFLVLPREEGGPMHSLRDLDPSLERYVTFEEYPSTPAFYTLNGFGYTLLGLYDWSQVAPAGDASSDFAAHYLSCGLATLVYSLPFYDLDGFSAYDMGHVIAGVRPNAHAYYHPLHIGILHALQSVAPHPWLAAYEARWRSDVDDLQEAASEAERGDGRCLVAPGPGGECAHPPIDHRPGP